MEQIDRRPSHQSILSTNSSGELVNTSKLKLRKEIDRKISFTENNWINNNVQFCYLASLGFYFFMKPDSVRCYFCSLDLNEFDEGDDVLMEHLKYSPNCPLLRRRKTNNEPLNAEELDKVLPIPSFDECGSKRRESMNNDDFAQYPDYQLLSDRMKSYETWPIGIKQRPQDLSAAGFFYSGQSDVTICFSCGLLINDWEEDDNPWIEHKRLVKKECKYLKFNQDQVKLSKRKVERRKDSIPLEKLNSYDDSEKQLSHDTICKICFSNKSTIVFIPCKHVAVCGQCLFGIGDNCPICRSPIDDKIALYFS